MKPLAALALLPLAACTFDLNSHAPTDPPHMVRVETVQNGYAVRAVDIDATDGIAGLDTSEYPSGIRAVEIHAAVRMFGIDNAVEIFPQLTKESIEFVMKYIPQDDTFGRRHIDSPFRSLVERVERARARCAEEHGDEDDEDDDDEV